MVEMAQAGQVELDGTVTDLFQSLQDARQP
jgi:hypothetical protein